MRDPDSLESWEGVNALAWTAFPIALESTALTASSPRSVARFQQRSAEICNAVCGHRIRIALEEVAIQC